MSKIEILAPVGTAETFQAALDGGADVVYVGAPGFNARNPVKELRMEEIGAMIAHCHSLGKKLYIAANSLILERELQAVIESLALFQELQPDALIVQDLGLLHLIKQYFPNLRVHGSTLMTVHNSDGVRFLGDQGCDRVVLARELTLKEIETIAGRAGGTELEVFIHGAMCFSYSGLCLFSSYLGGKSSLRGRCVQPCRRGYSSSGRGGKGKAKGGEQSKYLFSMNDLTGLEVIPTLKELGISSLKIEGRLRSPHYVKSVVEAYRLMVDADASSHDSALIQGQKLVDKAMSRKTSSGYFFTPQPAEAITPFHSGNMGIHLGRFSTVKTVGGQSTCKFTIKGEMEVGDRLRLHVEPSGERTAFRLKTLFVTGQEQAKANIGSKVSIELPSAFSFSPGSRVEVYRVDGAFLPSQAGNVLKLKDAREKLQNSKKHVFGYVNQIVDSVCGSELETVEEPSVKKGVKRFSKHRVIKKKVGIEWWLKTDSVKILFSKISFTPDRYLVTFEKQMLSQVGQIKKTLGKRSRLVTWVLPPLIMENDLVRVRKQIRILLRTGFRSFQIGHVSQVKLFEGEKVHLFGDYTLNVINSQAVAQLQNLGLDSAQTGIELDKKSLGELLAACGSHGRMKGGPGWRKIPLGLYAYGAPPLYTSRIASKHFPYEQQIQSPRKEPYIIRKKDGYTQTFPEKPFSLLPYIDEIKEAGIGYIVVDTCGHSSKKGIEDLQERLAGAGRYSKLPTFNYLGTLE